MKNKQLHALVGLTVALFALVTWWALWRAGLVDQLHDAPAAGALAGLVAGITKEFADWLDNRARPGEHGVELLDAVATAAPGAVLWLALAHL